jgi:hypothetical protein
MLKTPHPRLEKCRVQVSGFPETRRGDMHGWFFLDSGNAMLRIMSSGSMPAISGWEHVSVSLEDRIPTWQEMCLVKSLFWGGQETVLQFHPKITRYVNHHENCLHLWKKIGVDHELPPTDHV